METTQQVQKLKELYNQYLLTDIISFNNFKKSTEKSYKLYCKLWQNNKYYKETKPPYNFLEFISRLVNWNNIYGVSDLDLKEKQEFYIKQYKNVNQKKANK